eukprot:jgi/Botrbrau1/13259/Bobra.0074s0007.1
MIGIMTVSSTNPDPLVCHYSLKHHHVVRHSSQTYLPIAAAVNQGRRLREGRTQTWLTEITRWEPWVVALLPILPLRCTRHDSHVVQEPRARGSGTIRYLHSAESLRDPPQRICIHLAGI